MNAATFAELVADVDDLNHVAWLAEMKRLEAEQRELDARRAVMLASGERRRAYRSDGHATMFGLRAMLGWSNAEFRSRTQLARVIDTHPEIGESLLDTCISVANASAIARSFANPRCGQEIVEVLGTLPNDAQRFEYGDFRHVVRGWELLADAEGAHRDRELIHEHRTASFTEWDGKGTLICEWGDVDTVINKAIFERFVRDEWDSDWAWTVATYGDDASVDRMPRSAAQRAADAISAIIRRAGSIPKGGRPPRPAVNIHVDFQSWSDLMTMAGLFPARYVDPFEQGDLLATQLRCETGVGDLLDPVAVLRASLEGYVRFVVLNDDGVPIRWGRERRLFEGAAREAVMMLSTRCTQPGCRVKASHCEADHLVEWSRGGSTNPDNGGPKCDGHNKFRNRGYVSRRDKRGWHTYRPDGSEIC